MFIDCSKSSIGKPPISVKVRITTMVVINIIHFTVEDAECLKMVNIEDNLLALNAMSLRAVRRWGFIIQASEVI